LLVNARALQQVDSDGSVLSPRFHAMNVDKKGGVVSSERPRVLVFRLVFFVILAGFICLGPAYRQVFGRRSNTLRHWTMFHGFGSQVCDVRYFWRRADGGVEPIDRFALLGVEAANDDSQAIRTIRSVERAEEIAEQLCERLPAGEREVRLIARCGSKKGWVNASDGSRNLCRAAAPAAAEGSP